MTDALVIKTEMMLPKETMAKYQKMFAEQLKTGVVIIPPYFEATLLNVPRGVEVIVESAPRAEFIEKALNLKGEN